MSYFAFCSLRCVFLLQRSTNGAVTRGKRFSCSRGDVKYLCDFPTETGKIIKIIILINTPYNTGIIIILNIRLVGFRRLSAAKTRTRTYPQQCLGAFNATVQQSKVKLSSQTETFLP